MQSLLKALLISGTHNFPNCRGLERISQPLAWKFSVRSLGFREMLIMINRLRVHVSHTYTHMYS